MSALQFASGARGSARPPRLPAVSPPAAAADALLQVELQSAVRSYWIPPKREITRWARAALGPLGNGRELSVRVTGRRESRALNARYRGRDKPTNVLSFPAAGLSAAAPLLGDLVICAAVVDEEAREQGKALKAHWAHLVVHGALHLVGYDHERSRDAQLMERLEVRVLRGLGFPDPYRSN